MVRKAGRAERKKGSCRSASLKSKKRNIKRLFAVLLHHEEEKQRYQQGEDAQSFGHREAEDQAAELAVSC